MLNVSLFALFICATKHFTDQGCLLGLFSFGLVTVHMLYFIYYFHVWHFVFMLQVTCIKKYRS